MTQYQPPKNALRLLRLFCSEERLEELEGDLYEIYQENMQEKSVTLAQLSYWWMVVRSFRRYALKNSNSKLINTMTSFLQLFKHHLLISGRQLWKYRTTTVINVLGLSIGIATFISILSFVLHENSYNKHIPEKESIYRVYSEFTGTFMGTNRGVPAGVGPYLSQNLPTNMEAAAPFHTETFLVQSTTDQKTNDFVHQKVVLTDGTFFDVFQQYNWLVGAPHEALNQPNRVVLSLEQAEKYLGKRAPEDYLDEKLQYDDSLTVYVSGIVTQFEGNTDFIFGDFISLKSIETCWLKDRIDLKNWDNFNSSSQLWFRASKPLNENEKIALLSPLNAKMKEMEKDEEEWTTKLKTAPLTGMHFDQTLSIFDFRERGAANKQTLTVLVAVSIALLVLAIINFVNLEIAQLRTKMKEVGVRKVMGGQTDQLLHRFLTASFLVTLMAGLLAIPLSFYGGLLFEDYLPTSVLSILNDMYFIWVILGTILIVSLIAGFYPALVFSRFSPIQAFAAKRLEQTSSGSFFMRRAFVTFQFICSQLLIIGSLIIYLQLDFMRTKDVGFTPDNIMFIRNPWSAATSSRELFYNKMQEIPELTELMTQQAPPAIQGYSSTFVKHRRDSSNYEQQVMKKWGDAGYLDFYGIDIIAGRQVAPAKDAKEVVINDTYRKLLEFDSPNDAVGEYVEMSDEQHQIVGVMADFHSSSMAHRIDPTLFQYSTTKYMVAGKFNPENLEIMVEKVTEAFKSVYPNLPAQVNFQDQTLIDFYRTEAQMAKLTGYATVIALLISCMGLFGLISLSIEQRIKEIGIRKVLGADMSSIAKIISKEFVFLILLSTLISIPIIYTYGTEWLSNYEFAIDLSWWIYVLGGLVSIVIALLVTSTKVIQATKTNPVDCLRYE